MVLVLSRKHGEEVVIASNVRVTVLAVHGNRVKLGITAPRDVVIRREELDDRTELPSAALAETRNDSPPLRTDAASPHRTQSCQSNVH